MSSSGKVCLLRLATVPFLAHIQFLYPSSENSPDPGFSFSQSHLFLLSDGLFPLGSSRLVLCSKTMSVRVSAIFEVVDFTLSNKLLRDQLFLTEALCNSVEDIGQAY